jgi:uncharacterized membrane protein YgaE (UPF0421/DUF939 family)
MRSLHRQFYDHVEYAVRQAVGAVIAASISEIRVVRVELAAPFLVGVLALLVTRPHFGETMTDIYSLLTAFYGLLLAWPVAYGIGPHTEWAHALALFCLVFLSDVLDARPLRPKLAQLLALIVFASFAAPSNPAATRETLALMPLRLMATVAIAVVPPFAVACVWPRRAVDQILLRVRAAAHLTAIAFTLSSRALYEDRDSPAVSADGLRARGLRRLAQELVAQATTMLPAAAVERSMCIGVSRANEHAQLQRMQSNLLAMERTLNVRFRPRFRYHMAHHLRDSVAAALLGVRRQLRPDLADTDDNFVISDDVMRDIEHHRVFDRPHSFEKERNGLVRALYELRRDLYRNRGVVEAEGASDATTAAYDPVHFVAHELSAVMFWVFHALSYLRHVELMLSGSPETIGLKLTNVVDGDEFQSAESSSDSPTTATATAATPRHAVNIDAPPEASVAAPTVPFAQQCRARALPALRNAVAVVVASLMFLVPELRAVWHGFGVWCAVSTLLVMERDTGQSLAKSIRRLTGTALGSAFGAILVQGVQHNVYGVLAGLFAWILVLGFVRSSLPQGASYSAYVAGFTPILVAGTTNVEVDDSNLVAILRIQLSFLGVFVGVLASSLPVPAWPGKRLLADMGAALRMTGELTRNVVHALTHSKHETNIEGYRRLVSSLEPTLTLLQSEPVLWNVPIPHVLSMSVIKRLTCVQRRLVWCNSAVRRLHSSTSAQTLHLFVDPLESAWADAAEKCTVYLEALAELVAPLGHTIAERRDADARGSAALLVLKCATNNMQAKFNEVSHAIVAHGTIRMQTRDALAVNAFVFAFDDLFHELNDMYQDVTQLSAALQLRADGVVASGAGATAGGGAHHSHSNEKLLRGSKRRSTRRKLGGDEQGDSGGSSAGSSGSSSRSSRSARHHQHQHQHQHNHNQRSLHDEHNSKRGDTSSEQTE